MIRYCLLTSVAVLGLYGCTSSQSSYFPTVPKITYENLNTIPVGVSRIVMTSDTQRGAQPWDMANDLPNPPDKTLQRYLNQRYEAKGRNGVLNVVLRKADISRDSVPNDNALLSFIPLANNEDYVFEIIIDLESQYQSGSPNMRTTKRFVRRVKMPLNVTMDYREAKLQRTLEEMVRDIDEAMIETLSNQFNIIAAKDVPNRSIYLETKVPKKATGMGNVLDNISTSLTGGTDEYREKMRVEEARQEAAQRNPDYKTPVLVEPLPAE